MSSMFHVVLSGPPAAAQFVLGQLRAAGYPADIDPTRQGLPENEPGTLIIELQPVAFDENGEPTEWADVPVAYAYDGPRLEFVEVIGNDDSALDDICALAARFGYLLRVHAFIEAPSARPAADPHEARIAALEAKIAALTGGAR